MSNSLKKIKIISNNSDKTKMIKRKILNLIKRYGFSINEDNPDIIVIIGGDGTFLKALKQTNYKDNIVYIGVNTGHLGFLQDIKCEELEMLFYNLKNKRYTLDTLSIGNATFYFGKDSVSYKFLNEIVIREKDLRVLKTEVLLNNSHLEDFSGDGFIISTSSGSTAYNLSLGGSIIYPSIDCLQMKPLAPLPSSKHFSNLNNSIILPKDIDINIIPKNYYRKNILSIIDGEKLQFGININKINIKLSCNKIKILRIKEHDFCMKINEKYIDY